MFEDIYIRFGKGPLAACLPLNANLLSSLYALPTFTKAALQPLLESQSTAAPWADSLKVAPEQTARAIDAMLKELMLASAELQPDGIEIGHLDPNSRLFRHLGALLDLWRRQPDVMDPEIRTIQAFLASCASDALHDVKVIWDHQNSRLSALERRVVERLEEHHGSADPADADLKRLILDRQEPQAPKDTTLGHLQRSFLDKNAPPVEADNSLFLLSVRDSLQECEMAAAITQRWLETDRTLRGGDIGIILPDTDEYSFYLEEAFGYAGLHLSSLTGARDIRNVGAEAVLLFVQCRKRPAPSMALASLYSSPIMSWPASVGRQMAKSIMDGRFNPHAARSLTGRADALYQLIRKATPNRPSELAEDLRSLAALLSQDEAQANNVYAAQSQINRVAAYLDALGNQTSVAWDEVIQVAASFPQMEAGTSGYYIDGVNVIKERQVPRRAFRKLIVLGFNDGRYPKAPSGNPFFLDSEIEELEHKLGLGLPSQAKQLARGLDLFASQMAAASEELVLLCSERTREGKALPASSTLPLLARLMKAGAGTKSSSPEKVITPFERAEAPVWKRLIGTPEPQVQERIAPLHAPTHIELGRDLLALRTEADGTPAPQSPSKLENLLISPLAWTLAELDARHVPWAPEQLNVALRGTLAHEVFELLFKPDEPIPEDEQIDENVPALLQKRIAEIAPFLQGSSWGVERRTLETEIAQAARRWALVLKSLDAKVIGNEFWLRGELFGHPVRGKADCLIVLPNGMPLIVDYKKSSSSKRRKRLSAQWDLQVDLYRKMQTSVDEKSRPDEIRVRDCLTAWQMAPAVAYHLLNDGKVLANGAHGIDTTHVETIDLDIAEKALAQIQQRFERIRAGIVDINHIDDIAFYEKKAHLGTYAFDSSPLIKAFMRTEGEPLAPVTETPDA